MMVTVKKMTKAKDPLFVHAKTLTYQSSNTNVPDPGFPQQSKMTKAKMCCLSAPRHWPIRAAILLYQLQDFLNKATSACGQFSFLLQWNSDIVLKRSSAVLTTYFHWQSYQVVKAKSSLKRSSVVVVVVFLGVSIIGKKMCLQTLGRTAYHVVFNSF